jgi:hypothetical protein
MHALKGSGGFSVRCCRRERTNNGRTGTVQNDGSLKNKNGGLRTKL